MGVCLVTVEAQPALAEGSRTLYPNNPGVDCPGGAFVTVPAGTHCRTYLQWGSGKYGSLVNAHTLLRVYAQAGETIFLGSSALGVAGAGGNTGDVLLYDPTQITGTPGNETLGTVTLDCLTAQPGNGHITSRLIEQAGARSLDGTANTGGYVPCTFLVPTTGIYGVEMYGPDGPSANFHSPGNLLGQINSPAGDFGPNQEDAVTAWDVTVRASAPTNNITDLNGRLFTYALVATTAGNGRPSFFSIFPVTTDGYQYQTDVRGLDPNGFVSYGNQTGFNDTDGSPLYRDVTIDPATPPGGPSAQLTQLEGGTSLAAPQYPIFFNTVATDNLALTGTNGLGITVTPVLPVTSNLQFSTPATTTMNVTLIGVGGTFSANTTAPGVYDLVISRDGVNFDPTAPGNKVLRGVINTAGTFTVNWNGLDNSGQAFPNTFDSSGTRIGTAYPVHLAMHSGEYHFPLLDAENNTTGGPTFTLLNAPAGSPCPGSAAACRLAYYDDRNYKTANLAPVTIQTCFADGTISSPLFSDPINGYDSSTNPRAYGTNTDPGNSFGNDNNGTGTGCGGSFGDTKGLDSWTYSLSNSVSQNVDIYLYPNAVKTLMVSNNQVNLNTKFNAETITLLPNNLSGNWATSISYGTGASGWLSLNTTSGSLIGTNQIPVTISANSTGLANGTYTASISFVANGDTANPTVVNVQLVIGAAYTYYLPNLANGLNGFTSHITVQNSGSLPASIQAQYFDRAGNDMQVQTASPCNNLAVNARCSAYNPFTQSLSGTGVLYSDQPLSVIVAEDTPFGASAYAVAAGASSSLVAPLAINQALGFSTQLNILNTGSSAAQVKVSFFDQSGAQLTSATKTVTIAAHASLALDQTAADSGLASGFYGWSKIEAITNGSQLVAQVLEQNGGTHFVALANAQAQAQTTLYAPAMYRQAFGGFVTGANIVNPNSQAVQVIITYYQQDGKAFPAQTFTLAAHAVQPIYQGAAGTTGLPAGGLPNGFIGAASVNASAGVVMAVNEANGTTAAGTAQSGTYLAASSGSSSFGLPVVANNAQGGYTSGVTVLNTSAGTVAGHIYYYSQQGVLVSQQDFSIAAHSSQLAYQGAANLPSGFMGQAVIVTSSGATNSLLATANVQSDNLFYSYTEPAQ
jgi:hypothetical protein